MRLCQTCGVQPEQQVACDPPGDALPALSRTPLAAAPEPSSKGASGWQWRVLFERRDLWVGLYWDRKPDGLHVYLCPLPTLAVHAHRKA